MRILAGSVIALLGACASNDQIPISAEAYDDIATSLASTLRPAGGGGELGALLDIEMITRGGMPAGFAAAADGALYGEHVGLSYRYEMACRDANNRPLPACDPRTANADARVTWSGVLELPELPGVVNVIDRDGSWIVNDITDQTLRIDGEGDMTYASAIENPERGTLTRYEVAYEASHRRIVLGRDEPFPRTGTVVYALDVRRTRTAPNTDDTRDLTLTAELQFAAGGSATLALDGARTYEVDLETGAIVRVDRRTIADSDRGRVAHRAPASRALDASR